MAALHRTQQQGAAEGQGSLQVRGQAPKSQKCKEGKSVAAWCPHRQDECHLQIEAHRYSVTMWVKQQCQSGQRKNSSPTTQQLLEGLQALCSGLEHPPPSPGALMP